MTFGSTFGRVFSPTFQPKSQAASGGWWDLNGTISSCVVALQPLKAASAADSLLPVHGSLSEALSSKLALYWTADKGWDCDGSQTVSAALNEIALFAGLSNSNCSWVIKIANPVSSEAGDRDAFAFRYGGSYALLRVTTTGDINMSHINSISAGAAASGVYGFGGTTAYVNGSSVGTISSATFGASSNADAVGSGYAAARRYVGEIHALACYNAALTSTQIGNITTAMAAL